MTVVMPHHSYSIWQFVALVVWVLCQRCSAIDTAPLEKLLGDAILRALEIGGITVKDACSIQRVDESHWRKALRAEPNSHVSLTRLVRLPFIRFWVPFMPLLVYLVAQKHMTEIADDMGLRR